MCVLYALVNVFMGLLELKEPGTLETTKACSAWVKREGRTIADNRDYLLGHVTDQGLRKRYSRTAPEVGIVLIFTVQP